MPIAVPNSTKNERIVSAIAETVTAAQPKINKAVTEKLDGDLILTLHIQHGRVSQITSHIDEPIHSGGQPNEADKDAITREYSRVLKVLRTTLSLKLMDAAAIDFFGRLILSLQFEAGILTHGKASCEQVHKPSSKKTA